MINKSTVKEKLNVDIAISGPMAEALQLWSQMYSNDSPWLTSEIKSLNLAAAISGEISRAVTIEMKVDISGDVRAKYLQSQLSRVLPKLRQQVEFGSAKGGLMFKPFVNGKGIDVDYVQADCFYPVAFDTNGNITSCVFADQRTIGDKYYTRLEFHQMIAGGCVIKNMAFRSTTKSSLGEQIQLTLVDAWKELQPEATITGIDKPLFAYFRYPLANNVDPSSPLGVSAYSRSTELIQQADIQWSQLMWEFESGKRAIFVDPLAFGKTTDGKSLLPDKRLFRTVGFGGSSAIGEGSSEDLFHDWTPEFRDASITSGLDSILKRIEFNCGLSYGVLSDPNSVEKTATELKISQQRYYATVTDTQKALQTALDQLLYAMDMYATLYKLSPAGTYTVTYDFDDSIITDKELQLQTDLRLVSIGIMPKWEFRMRNMGEDKGTAMAAIAAVQTEQPVDAFQDTGD